MSVKIVSDSVAVVSILMTIGVHKGIAGATVKSLILLGLALAGYGENRQMTRFGSPFTRSHTLNTISKAPIGESNHHQFTTFLKPGVMR